jgi:tetratricopeptide (TPR) repeat protein
LIFPFEDTLSKLWNEARGDFVGGTLAAIVIAVAGVVLAVVRKRGGKRNLNDQPAAPIQHSQPVQPLPQELVLKFEGVSPSQVAPQISASKALPRSIIPRPPLAGFVARRDENGRDIVERLKEELLPEKEQLMVLWGAGGVGKTTIAAETARAMRDIFTGGIIWTTADGKPDFALSTLLDEIATQLGRSDLRQLAPEPKDEAVHHVLSTAPSTLIVLDNFETISPAEQEKCARWLANRASCPALITSRDQVVHARPVRILAMSLPEAREFLQRLMSELGNPPVFENLDPEQVIESADRIPLVLQWVVRQISSARQPQTVLDELAHGEGDAAKRVFDRSFVLPQLGDDCRATLLALSLFVPDASRIALAEVAGFGQDLARLDVAVQQLVELWLIQATAANERLRVEGLTRELTKARLARTVKGDDYRRRFVLFFRRYAEEHDQQRTEDYTALKAERDNLLNSMDFAFELKEWGSVQSLAGTIANSVDGWLSVSGYWTEALRANQQAFAAAQASDDQYNATVFAYNQAILYADLGELEKARTLFTDSLRVFKELGNELLSAAALHAFGNLARTQGDMVEARRLYSESLAIKRNLGEEAGISTSLHELAALAYEGDEFVEARRFCDEAFEIDKRLGNSRGIARSLHQLAMLAFAENDLEKASALYNDSLKIRRQLGDQVGISDSLHELGRLAQEEGELTVAEQLYNESLAIEQKLGNQSGIAATMFNLGLIAEQQGNQAEAARLYRDALEIYDLLKSPNAEMVRESLERVEGKPREQSSPDDDEA